MESSTSAPSSFLSEDEPSSENKHWLHSIGEEVCGQLKLKMGRQRGGRVELTFLAPESELEGSREAEGSENPKERKESRVCRVEGGNIISAS